MRKLGREIQDFWCKPEDGASLALPRLILGALFCYSLIVYWPYLEEFFLRTGWLPPELLALSPRSPYNWTWLSYIDSLVILKLVHLFAIGISVLFALGVCLPLTAPLVAVTAISYVNRNEFVIFGFDQTLTPFLLYLVFHRKGIRTGNQVAKRLMQIHLCFIYLGAGIAKIHPTWFNGVGLWRVLATYETGRSGLKEVVYLLAAHPWVLTLAGAFIVLWECSHPFLLWIGRFRPYTVALAITVHGGIAVFMRLGAFSLVMIAANCCFLAPELWLRLGSITKGRLTFWAKADTMTTKKSISSAERKIHDDKYV